MSDRSNSFSRSIKNRRYFGFQGLINKVYFLFKTFIRIQLIDRFLRIIFFARNRKYTAKFEKYRDFTMIPKIDFIKNLKLIEKSRIPDGCIVECGVWRGGMSAAMAEILENRISYLFDSFEGLPNAEEIDGEAANRWQADDTGEYYFDNCRAEMSFAEKAMKSAGNVYKLIKGWFSDTLPGAQFDSPIAVLRLDGDWYESTYTCLKYLFPKLTAGSLVIIDDYATWDGCSRAVHDYFSENKLTEKILQFDGRVSYFIKS